MPVKSDTEYSIRVPVDISNESTAKFELEIESMLHNSHGRIRLDCSHLGHASSSQVGLMWLAYQKCKENQVQIELGSPSEGLIRILQVLNIDEFLAPGYNISASSHNAGSRPNPVHNHFNYRDCFLADSQAISKSLEKFKVFLENANVPGVTSFELSTIFYEVTMNIVSHSTISSAEKIEFSTEIFENQAILTFCDRGVSFNQTIVNESFKPLQAAKQKKINGFGLYLINKLIDSSSYSRRDDGTNLLVLEKKWSE